MIFALGGATERLGSRKPAFQLAKGCGYQGGKLKGNTLKNDSNTIINCELLCATLRPSKRSNAADQARLSGLSAAGSRSNPFRIDNRTSTICANLSELKRLVKLIFEALLQIEK